MSYRALLRTVATYPGRAAASLIEPPAIALLYHRVSHVRPDTQLLSVTPEHFEQHLRVLSEEFTVRRPPELLEALGRGEPFSRGSVLLTFDDGYADNALTAVPLLEQYSLPAVFFIATEFLELGKEMWWDRLERCLFSSTGVPPTLRLLIDGTEMRFDTAAPAEVRQVMNALHPHLKYRRSRDQETILAQLHAWSGTPVDTRESHRPMTWAELATMASSSSVTIGSHSHTHTPFRILTEAEQKEEFLHSRSLLESHIGHALDIFSFPYGLSKDYGPSTAEICERSGYTFAFANVPDHLHRWSNPHRIPRFIVRDWDKDEFRARIRSYFSPFPRP